MIADLAEGRSSGGAIGVGTPAGTDRVSPVMDRNAEPRTSSAARTENSGSEDGMGVLSYVLAGLILYGGIGWLMSRWLHQTWIIPVGMVVGLAASVYLIVKRYGSGDPVSRSNEEDK